MKRFFLEKKLKLYFIKYDKNQKQLNITAEWRYSLKNILNNLR